VFLLQNPAALPPRRDPVPTLEEAGRTSLLALKPSGNLTPNRVQTPDRLASRVATPTTLSRQPLRSIKDDNMKIEP